MKRSTIYVAVPICLALACLSQPAAAGITHGSEDDPGKYNPADGTCSSTTRLNVAPGPGAGGAANPADYGMCGLLHLSGIFDSLTAAQIVVDADGYYNVKRTWSGSDPAGGPKVQWTCVLFTDFTGLPSDDVAGLASFAATPVSSTGGGKATNMIGPNDACIWAGLNGAPASKYPSPIFAFAQNDGTFTLARAKSAPTTSIASYAFCNQITGFPWAPYLNNAAGPALGDTLGVHVPVKFPVAGSPGVPGSRWWCYVDGVGTLGLSRAREFTFAGLGFVGGDTYYYEVGRGSGLWFNCLSLEQQR